MFNYDVLEALARLTHEFHEFKKEVRHDFAQVRKELNQLRPPATGFTISQIQGETMAGILGILPGATGTFVGSPIPSNGALQAGSIPVYTADDPAVVLAVVASDPSGLTVTATVPATDTQGSAPAGSAGSFNLTLTGVNSAGATITDTVNVPILPTPPPPPPPATGFVINQTS